MVFTDNENSNPLTDAVAIVGKPVGLENEGIYGLIKQNVMELVQRA